MSTQVTLATCCVAGALSVRETKGRAHMFLSSRRCDNVVKQPCHMAFSQVHEFYSELFLIVKYNPSLNDLQLFKVLQRDGGHVCCEACAMHVT